jgi:predicted metal-binding membrane protein
VRSPANNFERRLSCIVNGCPRSDYSLLGVSAALFVVSASFTIVGCAAMSSMPAMPMPGGWTMSMTWMPIPGQTWPALAASFLGMWTVMMVAMMLPSLVPVLRAYFGTIRRVGDTGAGLLTTLVGTCYFLVWLSFGAATFLLGAGLAVIEMRSPMLARTVPLAGSAAVLLGGVVQGSAWKGAQLACCRRSSWPSAALASAAGPAMRYGLRLGVHCVCCCFGLTVVLLVLGLMDWRAMAVVTAAITLERLAPRGERIARVIGSIVIGTGLVLTGRAIGIE